MEMNTRIVISEKKHKPKLLAEQPTAGGHTVFGHYAYPLYKNVQGIGK